MAVPFRGPVPTGDWGVASMVVASIWSMFAITTVFLSLRIYCRIIRTKGLWWDDYLLVASWLFLLISTALLAHVFRLGYTTTSFGSGVMLPMNLAADDMHKLALGLSKTSFAVTLLGFTTGWPRYVIIVVIVVMNSVFLTHSVLVWRTNCGSPNPYTFTPCWDASSGAYMNMIGSIFSAASDFLLALLPVKVIMGLNMKRREKIGVAVAMSIGILAGVVGIVKSIQSMTITNIRNPRFAHNLAILSIWIEAEPNATIIAASIPILRILFRDMKDSITSSPGAGVYIKSNNRSKFHQSADTRSGNNSRKVLSPEGNISQRSILPKNDEFEGGIKKTSEVVIDYRPYRRSRGYEHEGYELENRSKDLPH